MDARFSNFDVSCNRMVTNNTYYSKDGNIKYKIHTNRHCMQSSSFNANVCVSVLLAYRIYMRFFSDYINAAGVVLIAIQ